MSRRVWYGPHMIGCGIWLIGFFGNLVLLAIILGSMGLVGALLHWVVNLIV